MAGRPIFKNDQVECCNSYEVAYHTDKVKASPDELKRYDPTKMKFKVGDKLSQTTITGYLDGMVVEIPRR